MKILVTGGTEFVSRAIAAHFSHNHEVYVLNRGNRLSLPKVTTIIYNRHQPFDLKDIAFDYVIDVTAYTKEDVELLLGALKLDKLKSYVLISSSAVYPEFEKQPFKETCQRKENVYWKQYGTDKIAAENTLMNGFSRYYIIRPPYLYGPGNNVYREAFVFDCAKQNRPFYLPNQGEMTLQFFYIEDLCRFIKMLLVKQPLQRIFNVGNPDVISIKDWVEMCYATLGKKPSFVFVSNDISYRSYFPFYHYQYRLDTTNQERYFHDVTSLEIGLMMSWNWYQNHEDLVKKKPLIQFIEENL